jgi:hypothetical protein
MVNTPCVYGCPGCGGSFLRTKWQKVKDHMRTCCPEQFEGNAMNTNRHGNVTAGHLSHEICKLGHPRCVVPGHTFEIYEAKRMSQKAAKEEERRLREEAEALKPKWTEYDKRLDGTEDGSYSGVQELHILDPIACSGLRAALEKEFDQNPNGPYGVQAAMGTRQEWIHWALVLAKYPDRTKVLEDEYQNDIHIHIKTLDKLGDEAYQGYQGSYDYVRALHCILHDTFRRCHLPPPAFLNLTRAMWIRGDSEYKSRMRSFHGYKYRVFGIVKIVKDNPLPIEALTSTEALPDIVPAAERSALPAKRRRDYY